MGELYITVHDASACSLRHEVVWVGSVMEPRTGSADRVVDVFEADSRECALALARQRAQRLGCEDPEVQS